MLTRKQHELLMYIHERIKETGVSPSFDEMKDALDLASKSGIHRLITALEERGFLREGYFADLVLVEDVPFTVKREDVLSKCGWSPFEGTTFRSRVASTWVNGQLVWDGSKLVGEPAGQRMTYDR